MRFALPALVLVAAAPLSAAPPEVLVRVDPPAITVGDRVWATLEVTVDADSPPPTFPAFEKSWGPAEILGREPIVREDAGSGRTRYRQRFALTAFETGRLTLPPATITVPGERPATFSTPADVVLVVESVLPAEIANAAPPPPRPPQPPRALPVGGVFWWSLGGGLTLLAAALLFVALRPRRPLAGTATAVPLLPPWPELLAGLAEAANAANPESAHVALSVALRRYLGRSFGFPALESTSREIGRELENRRTPHAAAARMREILAACDRVKFARGVTDRAAVETRITAAREAAAEIEAHLQPAPAPGAPLTSGRP